MNILINAVLVQIFLVVLRITNTIEWSWLLVLIPYEVIMILFFVGTLVESRKKKSAKNEKEEWEKAREEWRKVTKK